MLVYLKVLAVVFKLSGDTSPGGWCFGDHLQQLTSRSTLHPPPPRSCSSCSAPPGPGSILAPALPLRPCYPHPHCMAPPSPCWPTTWHLWLTLSPLPQLLKNSCDTPVCQGLPVESRWGRGMEKASTDPSSENFSV